ncbi:hypothetical protein PC116_g7431 [Phytophthora cactorum]|nr:hypothetical protein PC114_g5967 [Phytophthora cactorum]KAG4244736.1 hypothetical protein PC116_g7431 [Phytophthora cactorum]
MSEALRYDDPIYRAMFERGLTALSSLQKREAFIIPTPPPPTERQQSHQDISLFGYSLAPVYDFWERLQVSHCGQYSVERMLALDEYCQRVSIIRVLAVCLFFPFGPLIVIVLTECMPLESVDKGALANYVFWIRHAIMGTILVFCAMIQAKVWIPEVPLSVKQVLMVAIGSSVLYTALNILVAELWVFPIPFLVVAGAPVLISIWAIASRLVLGPHPVEGVQDGSFRGRRVLLLTAVHASLLAIYPAYQAVFLEVDGFLELAMFALLPVINLSLKNLQTALGSHLEDSLPETLQLLFNNEYLGLMAYTQCIIPVVYLLYMPILQALPNHVYYPTHYRYFGGENEFDERMTVIGILAGLQFAVLMALQVFVVKCFGVSTIYQIAFVLETHFSLLQGRLLMWLVFAVQSTLMHYGADFSFRFDWLHKSSPAN